MGETRYLPKFARDGITDVYQVNACSKSISHITHDPPSTCITSQCQCSPLISTIKYEHLVRNYDCSIQKSNPVRRDMCAIVYGPLCRSSTIARMDTPDGYRFIRATGRHISIPRRNPPTLGPMAPKLCLMQEIGADDATSVSPPPKPGELVCCAPPAFPPRRAFSLGRTSISWILRRSLSLRDGRRGPGLPIVII